MVTERELFSLQRVSLSQVNTRLNPYQLNKLDRKFFLESLRQAGKLQKQLASDFSQKMM